MSLTSEEKQQKLDELNEFIAQHKHDKGALMPVMQKACLLYTSKHRQLVIYKYYFTGNKKNIPLSIK